jgi:hypothetical protein
MTTTYVRDRELLDLIQQLEEALDIARSGIRMLGPDRSRIEPALESAIAYLCELRARNGGAAT